MSNYSLMKRAKEAGKAMARKEGRDAFDRNAVSSNKVTTLRDNPYPIGTTHRELWAEGFREASAEDSERMRAQSAEDEAQAEFERRLQLAIENGALRGFVIPSALLGSAK